MSRPLRIEYPGAWYHVMNRGRRGEDIFANSEDFTTFVDLLKQSVNLWDVRISAYCLMSNHYHLLVHTPQGNLSRFMRHLNGVYTQRYNRAHDCDGQLFRGRYKAILVDEDNYLLELVRYIHKNPVEASLVNQIDEYEWISHHGYLSAEKKWSWLHKDFILNMFTTDGSKRIDAYWKFVEQDDLEEIAQMYEKSRLPSIVGSDEFIDQIKNRFFADKSHSQIPDSVQLAPNIKIIKEAVCHYYGLNIDVLTRSKRGVVNEPRNVAIYLTRKLRREGLKKISAAYKMRGYSAAGNVIDRLEIRLAQDSSLQKCVDEIRRNITGQKSQVET